MTSKHEYKTALKRLDKDIRVCFLYLEGLIEERFTTAIATQQPPSAPRGDLREIKSALDSLQKQINGLRPKIEAGYKLALDHPEQEKYLKRLAKKTEEFIVGVQSQIKERYDAGEYSEGERRKLRKTGLLDIKKEENNDYYI